MAKQFIKRMITKIKSSTKKQVLCTLDRRMQIFDREFEKGTNLVKTKDGKEIVYFFEKSDEKGNVEQNKFNLSGRNIDSIGRKVSIKCVVDEILAVNDGSEYLRGFVQPLEEEQYLLLFKSEVSKAVYLFNGDPKKIVTVVSAKNRPLGKKMDFSKHGVNFIEVCNKKLKSFKIGDAKYTVSLSEKFN